MISKKRSRLALFGSLVLSLCLTVSLVGGADAAKKKKKKGQNAVSIQKLNVPVADRAVGAPQAAVTPITFAVPNSFGEKVVGNTELTLQVTGSAADYLDDIAARLIAPSRTGDFLQRSRFRHRAEPVVRADAVHAELPVRVLPGPDPAVRGPR